VVHATVPHNITIRNPGVPSSAHILHPEIRAALFRTHVKQMWYGCFTLVRERHWLSACMQHSSEKYIFYFFTLTSKCGSIYLKFLNGSTVVTFPQWDTQKLNECDYYHHAADVLSIKLYMISPLYKAWSKSTQTDTVKQTILNLPGW
jgi:hypothetical protein